MWFSSLNSGRKDNLTLIFHALLKSVLLAFAVWIFLAYQHAHIYSGLVKIVVLVLILGLIFIWGNVLWRLYRQHTAATADASVTSDGSLVQTMQQMQQKINELQQSNSDLANYAMIAAHELLQPVKQLNAELATLSQQPQSSQSLQTAQQLASTLEATIDNLLLLAQLKQPIEMEKVSCAQLLQQVLQQFAVQIDGRQAIVTHDPMPEVYGNDKMLYLLFHNLLDNALKFQGDSPLRLHISAKQHQQHWYFSFEDNGIGLADEHQQAVFELFYQVAKDVPGNGMGLTLCQRIITAHKGRIWLESTKGQGATVYFTLAVLAP